MKRTYRMGSLLGAVTLLGLGAAAGCGDNEYSEGICAESGRACTWLGKPGQVGYNGEGHHRLDTMIYWTMDMQFAPDGTAWFLDWNNHLVRKVTPDGRVHSVVGTNDPVFPGDGNLEDPGAEYSAEGAVGSEVQLNHPTDLHVAPDGAILLMAWHNHKIRRIDPDTGRVWILSGAGADFAGDGGPAASALYKQPSRFAFDEQENVFILDQQNQRIRRIDAATQIITTIAGSGVQGFAGDDGPAPLAKLSFQKGDNPEPSGGIAYQTGKLYIADTGNHRVRCVDLETGIITTIAGTGVPGFSGDRGPAAEASLDSPRDLEIGPDGDLYVADTENGAIRAIDLTTFKIRTVAGTGKLGLDAEDGLYARQTKLNRPFGIDFDLEGNLFISDSINSRIVKVTR